MVSITREFHFKLQGKFYTAKVTICRDDLDMVKGKIAEKSDIDEIIKSSFSEDIEIDFLTLEDLCVTIAKKLDKELRKSKLNVIYFWLSEEGKESYYAMFENL